MPAVESFIASKATKGGKNLMLTGGAGALAGILGILKPGVVVGAGEVGVRTRFSKVEKTGWLACKLNREGQLYGIIPENKGLRPTLSHNTKKVSIKDQTNEYLFNVDNVSGKQLEVHASFIWGVTPEKAHRSLVKIEEEGDQFAESVVRFCTSALFQVIQDHPNPRHLKSEEAYPEVVALCKDDLDNYGAELRKVVLGPRAASQGQLFKDGLAQLSDNGSLDPMTIAAAASIVLGMNQPAENGNGTSSFRAA